MDAPAQAADTRSTRRGWLRFAVRGILIGCVLAFGGEAGRILIGSNFHTVEPGKVYRCAQPTPAQLARFVRRYGIRTVINLRGCCSGMEWYLNECRTSAKLDICQEDLCLSAGRLPSVPEIRRLVDILDHCEYPVLFHCQRGADRTGLASVMALLLRTDVPYDVARRQLSLRYGHIALDRTANLDRFFDLYREWLDREGLSDSRDHFRRWVMHEYCPAECRGEIEPLDLPKTVASDEPFAVRVRVRNTSIKRWSLRPVLTSGVHVTGVVMDEHGMTRLVSRGGFFDAVVPPSESIDLTIPMPAVREAGHYRLVVDVIDEQQGNFFQMGSEPLEWDFEVREQ